MSSSSKPLSLAEFRESIKELTDDTIVHVQQSLETSLAKLHETNEYLASEISTTADQGDRQLYEETVEENKHVIASQQQKMETLREELRLRNLLPQEGSGEGVYL